MSASPTGLLASPDCGSQRERRDGGSHDLHPFTAGRCSQAIFGSDGSRCIIDCELSASSHEASEVARGRSTLVVILSRLSCLVASHHCFCVPCERIEGVREQTGEGSGGQ
jgi:hypothetical protein